MDEPGSDSNAPAQGVHADCPATLNSLARHMLDTAESEVALHAYPASHGCGAARPAALQYEPAGHAAGAALCAPQ